MVWVTLDDKGKIMRIIDALIRNRAEIRLLIKGGKTVLTTRFIKRGQRDISSVTGKEPLLIIDKVMPEKGNPLIQAASELNVGFSIDQHFGRCTLEYMGTSSSTPYFGYFVSFPESIQVKDKRSEERFVSETADFISAEFRLEKRSKKDVLYNLNVLDCSRHGLGMIVTQKDFGLLQILQKEDTLENIIFYTPRSRIKVNGTVSHITKITDGKHKGCYIIGIHSSEIIESCKSEKVPA
jgi:hypothetical protein